MASTSTALSRTEDGEISSDTDTSVSTIASTPRDNVETPGTRKKKKRKSRYRDLQEKMDKRFEHVESMMTMVLQTLKTPENGKTTSVTRSKPRTNRRLVSDLEQGSDSNDDIISIHAHISDEESGNEDDSVEKREENLSKEQKAGLMKMFGKDAVVKQDERREGLVLDETQINVLQGSYRCKTPYFLSAFSEDSLDMFPIDEDCEKWLEVPTLESMVESCMKKRYGEKAAFGKRKSLYTQPAKSVEKHAYKGQQAARMGLAMQMYVQQSLGNLLQELESPNYDKENSITMLKDIFAMSTKCLDQIGRAGAFHHIVRRAVCMTDTGLYEQENHSEFSNLPLTSEGVFGDELDVLLKARKEKKKQVEELIPDVKKSSKRKLPFSNSDDSKRRRDDGKRPVLEQIYDRQNFAENPGWSPNFRIPRVPRDYRGQTQGSGRGRFGSRRVASSGRGRLARTDGK